MEYNSRKFAYGNLDKMDIWREKNLLRELENEKLKELVKRHKKILVEYGEAQVKKSEVVVNTPFERKMIKNKVKQIEENDKSDEIKLRNNSNRVSFETKIPDSFQNNRIIRKNNLDWILKARQMEKIDEEDSEMDGNEKGVEEPNTGKNYLKIPQNPFCEVSDILTTEELKKLDIQRRLKKIQAKQLEQKLNEPNTLLPIPSKLPEIKNDILSKVKNPSISIITTQKNDVFLQSRKSSERYKVNSYHSSFTPPPKRPNISKLAKLKHQVYPNTHNSLSTSVTASPKHIQRLV